MTDRDESSKPRIRGVSLHVKGLLETITRQKLIEAFGRFGEVIDVHIPLDHVHKRVLGFAFVELESREQAEAAMKELDKKPLDGREISVAFAAERRKTADQMRHRSNHLRDNRESTGGGGGGGGRDRRYESYRRGDDRNGGYSGQDYGGRDDRSRDYGGRDDRSRDDGSRDDYRSSRRPYDSRDNSRGSRDDYRPYESSRDVSRGPGDRNRGDNPYSRDDDRHGRGDRWHDSGKGGGAYGDNRGGGGAFDSKETGYGGRYQSESRPAHDYTTQRRHIRPHYAMPPAGDEVRPREINESEVRGVGDVPETK